MSGKTVTLKRKQSGRFLHKKNRQLVAVEKKTSHFF